MEPVRSRDCSAVFPDAPHAGEQGPADALRSRAMVTEGLRLVCRREVDLQRVTSAACS